MWFKKKKNSVGVEVFDLSKADRIDEASATVTYFMWDTPGSTTGGVFTENIRADVFVMRISTTLTITSFDCTVAKWSDRATATYVPLSQRSAII